MKCLKCGLENSVGMHSCGKCGQNLYSPELAPKKLSFDEILAKTQQYNPENLTQRNLAQGDKIEGEQKQVTVMFCDMEGFTSFTKSSVPQEPIF